MNAYPDIEKTADLPVLQRTVMTVTGPILARNLGITLVAETVFGNGLLAKDHPAPLYPELWDQPVTLDALGRLRRDIWSNQANWDLTDTNLVATELHRFLEVGGTTVINTPYGGPIHPPALVEVAKQSGVQIISGLVPVQNLLDDRDEKAIFNQLVSEARDGIIGSTIRPGILGPIDVDVPEDPAQRALLKAVLQAGDKTGLVLLVRCPPEKLDSLVVYLIQCNAKPSRVILDVDVVPDPSSIQFHSAEGGAYGAIIYSRVLPDGLVRAAENGFYLAFASFGFEVYYDRLKAQSARDPQRILGIAQLIKQGHLHQILLSQGVRLKTQLRPYGGWGYVHILENIVPMLGREGFAPKQITTMLKWNPARALAGE